MVESQRLKPEFVHQAKGKTLLTKTLLYIIGYVRCDSKYVNVGMVWVAKMDGCTYKLQDVQIFLKGDA